MSLRILALDTSTEACSVAIYNNGEIAHNYRIAPQQHATILLPMLDALLANASIALPQLDAIAFGKGPGSFTGVRIAAAMTQAIAYAHDLPVIPVSTLQALAQGARRKYHANNAIAVLDARMQEIYVAEFAFDQQRQVMAASKQEQVIAPADYQVPISTTEKYLAIGPGWAAYADKLLPKFADKLMSVKATDFPEAQDIATLACPVFEHKGAVAAEQAWPNYLRAFK